MKLEEAIDTLKNKICDYVIPNYCKDCANKPECLDDCNFILSIYTVLQEKERLQKENEKLTEARDWYFECTVRQIATPEMLDKILKAKYINKNKIIEKIKEIYEDENSEYYDMFLEQRDIEKTIGILKDLLKEE